MHMRYSHIFHSHIYQHVHGVLDYAVHGGVKQWDEFLQVTEKKKRVGLESSGVRAFVYIKKSKGRAERIYAHSHEEAVRSNNLLHNACLILQMRIASRLSLSRKLQIDTQNFKLRISI
jgi:hypothetical protein